MAQVTYRGVKYDTDRNKTQQTNKVDLTYRGVRQKKNLQWLLSDSNIRDYDGICCRFITNIC
ncbi:MAG: hypothetical protein CM15mV5_1170 [uncultured marine virus]|nr:MAG: hypothetical protein CM15mV5_1170 [uncultured marine virus]